MPLQKIISFHSGSPSNVKRCIKHAQDYSGQLREPSEPGWGGGEGLHPTPILTPNSKAKPVPSKNSITACPTP